MNPEVMYSWEEMTVEELMKHHQDFGVISHQLVSKRVSMPPENELMKGTERQLSEAELRVRRSLQRLDVPDWMKNATPPQQGFLLRRRDYGSTAGGGGGGWSAYSSKTASMTSLGSSRAHTPNTPTKVVIPTRVATRGVGGLGGVMSPASNSSISPSPSDRSGSLFHYPSSRWSTSRLNSGTTTPTGSVTSSRTTATCGRQPYLGWRSQTSLASLAGSQSSLTSSGSYLTAADRLALGITAYSQRFVKQQQPPAQDKENCAAEANSVAQSDTRNQGEGGGNNGIQLQVPTDVADVHSSIKEVTSAIVHYCNESTPSPRASPRGSPRPEGRAPSPRRLVWVESSFVGSRPITSPETPTSSTHAITPTSQLNGHDLPEGGEVTPRPPQPPEVASLVNSLSSACSSLRDSSRDSTAASTNDSTAVIVDSSLGDSSRADSRHSLSDSGQSTVDRSTVGSRHSTADTVNSGLSSRNIDSLNSRSSVLSSAGCSSRGSVGSSSRSSSSRQGSSRDDMQASPGSDDLAPRQAAGSVFHEDGQQEQQNTPPPSHHTHPAPARYFSQLPGGGDTFEREGEDDRVWSAEGGGTSLEDVLDSLLALPAASRSPSPVSAHTLSRPFSHPGATHGSPEERQGDLEGRTGGGAGAGAGLPHYGHLGNHDVPSDYKTDGYHKSLSYSPAPPRPTPAPLLAARDEGETLSQPPTTATHTLTHAHSKVPEAHQGPGTLLHHSTAPASHTPLHAHTASAGTVNTARTPMSLNQGGSPALAVNSTTHTHPGTHSFTNCAGTAISTSNPAPCWGGGREPSSSTAPTSTHTPRPTRTNPQSHFIPDSSAAQVNQLGASPPHRPSQEVVPTPATDAITDALMLSGVIAAAPSIMEARPHPAPRVTFHLPPRHMNIPPDSSSENGNGNENVRVDADDESSGSSSVVRCRNPSCGQTADTEEARGIYKTCHNCCTFYCSRACRRSHWERHKRQCKRIRSLAVAKQVVARVREDEAVLARVSAVARRGSRALGRGTVKIFFHDIRAAETFVGGGEVPDTHYVATQNLLPQETGAEVYKQITDLCRHYSFTHKLVLYVSICIMNEIPTGSSPKWEREVVSHCAKLRLAGATGGGENWSPRGERHVITRDMDEPETLILTSGPIPASTASPQAARQLAFNNIVRHLRERGISLRNQYPDVYRKLTVYVEGGEVFPPLSIYPRDPATGATVMCIIMPETRHDRLQLLANDTTKVRTIDISRPLTPA